MQPSMPSSFDIAIPALNLDDADDSGMAAVSELPECDEQEMLRGGARKLNEVRRKESRVRRKTFFWTRDRYSKKAAAPTMNTRKREHARSRETAVLAP